MLMSSSADFARFSACKFLEEQVMTKVVANKVTFCEGLAIHGSPSPLMSNLGFGSSPKSKNSLQREFDCSLFVWSITEPGDSIHIAPSIEDKYLAWKSSLDVCSLALIRDTAGLV